MEVRKIASSVDGLPLEMMMTLPQKTPVGVVQIFHGMCEHKERYLPLMEYLSRHRLVCVIHDHRGHGNSVKSREDLGYFYGRGGKALVEDGYRVTCEIRKQFPDLPVILLGHSMGSLAARIYLKQHDEMLQGLILCGPPSKNPALPVGTALAKALRKKKGDRWRSTLLEGLVFGSYAAKFTGENSRFSWICSNEEIRDTYEQSPLCGFVFTLDGYLGLFELLAETYSRKGWRCKNPNLPIFFLGGAEDPCIGSKRKFGQELRHLQRVGYLQVKGKRYPGMRHEILNETGKIQVYRDMLKVIRIQLRKGERDEK